MEKTGTIPACIPVKLYPTLKDAKIDFSGKAAVYYRQREQKLHQISKPYVPSMFVKVG